jgi:hypothetical protein
VAVPDDHILRLGVTDVDACQRRGFGRIGLGGRPIAVRN